MKDGLLDGLLTADEIDKIFADKKAIFKGHFVYSAGGHGNVYIDKSEITFWPYETGVLCEDIAWQWHKKNIEVVIGPAIGGIKLADRVAEWLAKFTGEVIPALYTEKDSDGNQVLKRGIDKIRGKNTLVVEDIVNTGGSLKNTVRTCSMFGAKVIGCHSLVDRSSGKVTAETLGVPIFLALKKMDVANYSEGNCPLCDAMVPINTDRGHGAEYLKVHPEKANW